MAGLILMDLKNPQTSTINFDDMLGRPFLLPMDGMGREKTTISDHVHTLDQAQVSRED